MTRDEIRAFLMRRADAWARKDLDVIMADYAPDIVYIAPTVRFDGTAGMRENAARYLAEFTDIEVELTRLIVDGNQGALEWTWSETRVVDGRRRSVQTDEPSLDLQPVRRRPDEPLELKRLVAHVFSRLEAAERRGRGRRPS